MRTLPMAPLSPTSSLLESFNTSKTSRPRRTPTNSISYEPTAKNGCFCNEPRQSPSPLTRHLYVARIPTFLLCLDKCVHLKRKFEQPWKGAMMLATMQALGVIKSFSRPGVSDDNPFIEALFRHLKYAPAYPAKGFGSLDEARAWVKRFVDWYNSDHLHSSIAYVTPEQRHDGRDIAILENRRKVYQAARNANPSRWSRYSRQWHRPATVMLNPDRTIDTSHQVAPIAA